jgi:molybdate transport system permease protein
MPPDWSPLWLSLRYAGLATLLAILVALPLGWLLERRRFTGSNLLNAAVNLPLVLPPAVLVYYLLARLGLWPLHFNWHTATGVSAIYTLPLLLRLTWPGLAAVDHSFENAARGLGAGEWRIFWRITLPLAWRALFGAVLAGFARAFVDFFATALVAANTAYGAGSVWLILLVAAASMAALYVGSWVWRGQAPA